MDSGSADPRNLCSCGLCPDSAVDARPRPGDIQPLSGVHPAAVPAPAELLSPALASEEKVEQHLLDAFIPAAYRTSRRRPGGRRGSWTAAQAEPWLVFLANHLEQTVATTSLAWWQLERAVPKAVSKAAGTVAAAVGLAIMLTVTAGGSVGVAARLEAALAAGLGAGLVIYGFGRYPQRPMTGMGWSLGHIVRLVKRPQAGVPRQRPGLFVAPATGNVPGWSGTDSAGFRGLPPSRYGWS